MTLRSGRHVDVQPVWEDRDGLRHVGFREDSWSHVGWCCTTTIEIDGVPYELLLTHAAAEA